jgi:UDP-glucose 4-epimerase
VTDLAVAHVQAAQHLQEGNDSLVVNLGSEHGLSVRQILDSTRKITGKEIPEEIVARRPGDPAKLVASSAYAKQTLGWRATKSDVDSIIASTWRVYEANARKIG